MNPDDFVLEITPEEADRRHFLKLRGAIRNEITKLLDENRMTLARRAALALTNRVIVDASMRTEIVQAQACTDNLLDHLFEQFQADQSEGR